MHTKKLETDQKGERNQVLCFQRFTISLKGVNGGAHLCLLEDVHSLALVRIYKVTEVVV